MQGAEEGEESSREGETAEGEGARWEAGTAMASEKKTIR